MVEVNSRRKTLYLKTLKQELGALRREGAAQQALPHVREAVRLTREALAELERAADYLDPAEEFADQEVRS